MVILLALVIFVMLSAAAWFLSLAVYRSTFDGPDPAAGAGYTKVRNRSIGIVALTCLVPFPAGFLLGVIVWSVAVFRYLDLPASRGTALVCYLAAASAIERLAVLGVLGW